MSDTVLPSHEALLRLCAAAAPKPWYPKVYAQTSGVPRHGFDALLNDLRLNGLLRLTDWEKEQGQGYVLTELGEDVLNNPVYLAQFRSGLHGRAPTPPGGETATTAATSSPAQTRPADSATRSTTMTTYERGEAARRALYDPEPPRIVPILILINVIAFGLSFYLAMRAGVPVNQFATQGDPNVVHQAGGLRGMDLLHGDWWRLLTCCFLHFGLLHLLLNMYCLYVLGLLESLWGPLRFLFLYLVSGFGGSCVAMLYDPGTPVGPTLAGASGAIWGLMASLAAWVFMNRSHLPAEHVAQWVRSLGMIFLINIGVSFLPGISASAHFGGGAIGFIVATLLHVQRIAPRPRKTVATVLCVMLPFLLAAALWEAMEKDPRWQRLADFDKNRQHIAAFLTFRDHVIPAIDKADNAFEELEPVAFTLVDKKPSDRQQDARLPKLREEMSATSQLAKTALEKLGERPSSDEALEATRKAAREYMQLIIEQIERIQQLLDEEKSWTKEERTEMVAKMKQARLTWMAFRGQFQLLQGEPTRTSGQ